MSNESTRAKITRYYRSLPAGKLFTTRECLGFGLRVNVDQALYRLVKEGFLRRIVRGMFVCSLTGKARYSVAEIAALKASSFGKQIVEHSADIDPDLELPLKKNQSKTYTINGCTSAFRILEGNIKVVFKTACEKKMRIKSEAGKSVRALWQMGERELKHRWFFNATIKLSPEECQVIADSCAWMPHWLSDGFITFFNQRFQKRTC